jgi:GT2 family glycosyltransferase
VTPSFNQAPYIEETIRSVLLQGYPHLEYIIVDGGSTDGTAEMIRKYEPWLAYWVSEKDRGQSHAINKGLERATGTLCNWNNADDVLTKGSLAVTAAAMAAHPDASAVTGYIVVIDADSRVLSVNDGRAVLKGRSGFLHDTARCLAALKTGCQPGCLMDRDLVLEVGGVDERIHYAMDQDLLLRLMLRRRIYHVDHPVIMFRWHAASKTTGMTGARATERLVMARKLFATPQLPPSLARLRRLAVANAHGDAAAKYAEWGKGGRALYHRALRITNLAMHRLGGSSHA